MYRLMQAQMQELAQCRAILAGGREFQRAQGFVQWPDGFPSEQLIEDDIKKGKGYVLKVDDRIAAYMLLDLDGDPAYADERCHWHNEDKYVVIHRIAIAEQFRGKGIAAIVFDLVAEYAREKGVYNLRIDTALQNVRMQHVLERSGFTYRGLVIQGGGDRMAYDKQL